MEERKTFRGGGMDTDNNPSDVAPNYYLEAWNLRNTGNDESEAGDETNIESNQLISSPRKGGINKAIGSFGFELVRKGYGFIYNSQGFNAITEFDYDKLTEKVIFENLTNSNGIDILPFDPENYVTDCKLIQKRFLTFTYGGRPYYIDLVALKNGDLGTIVQEDILLLKAQPTKPPIARYNNDYGRQRNDLKNRIFQFRSQREKLNFELTSWSTISKRTVPTDEPTPSFGTNVSINNNLVVFVDAGTIRDKKINVAARYDMLDWFEIKSINRVDILALPDSEVDISQEIYEAYNPSTNVYSFAFYNDGSYSDIPILETDELYDHIWDRVESLEVINGSILAIAGLEEGYDRPSAEVSLTVSTYDPNISFETAPVDSLRIIETRNVRITNSHRRRVSITFAGQPKTGDSVFIQNRDIRDYSQVLNYNKTVAASQENNLDAFVAALATVVPNSATYGPQLNYLTPGYYELGSVRVFLANAGSGASKSIHSIKLNSSYQLALGHYDEFGRPFPLSTDESYVVKTPSYAVSKGLIPKIDWDIDSLPPVGADTYQWLISVNNTHENSLYINGSYDTTRSTADYITFNIKSLKKFNDTNSSSILNYEYSAGDRVTLHFTFNMTSDPIKWFDTEAIDVEVVAFDIVVDTAPEPDVTNYFLKIRKSSSLNVSDIDGKEVLMEVYTPRKRIATGAQEAIYFEIGEVFDVVNGEYSVKSGSITEADSYFKTRGLTGNLDVNTLYNLEVESFDFSDFYISNFTSYGRPRFYFDENGKVEKPASIRYSDTYITGGKVNGITRFYGNRIYGDGPGETSSVDGWIGKIKMRGNTLVCMQELKVWHIPVNISIVEDQVAQQQYAISDKLLNFVRPTTGDYGIGRAKESFAQGKKGAMYFVDPNNSLPMRDGYDGLSIISSTKTKWFQKVLKQAQKEKRKIIGFFDVFNDEYTITIELSSGVLTTFNFGAIEWELKDSYAISAGDLMLVSASNGSVDIDSQGIATFTPNIDYVGVAGFSFSFLDGEGNTVVKKSCGTVDAGTRVVDPFYFVDLVNQATETLLSSNSVLMSGMNIPLVISVTNGEFRVNGNEWTSIDATVVAGDVVTVRQTSSPLFETTTSTVLTVGTYSDSFDVTTTSDSPDNVSLAAFSDYNEGTQSFDSTFTLSDFLEQDLNISFYLSYVSDFATGITTIETVVIPAGSISASNSLFYALNPPVTDIIVVIVSVDPNPNGTKNVIY